MKKFDFIVIGGGSGNLVLDAALEQGLNCAVVEKGKFGGTCLNFGCIPTKVLATLADKVCEAREWESIGLEAEVPKVNFAKLQERLAEKLSESKDILEEYQAEENLTVYSYTARFKEAKVLELLDTDGQVVEEITADTIVIAAGGRSRALPESFYTYSEAIFYPENFFGNVEDTKAYEHVTMLGGGPIACEFAHIFEAFGSKVDIVQRNVCLLPKEDREISHFLGKQFEERGMKLHFETLPKRLEKQGEDYLLTVANKHTGEEKVIKTKAIFSAMGIVPNTDILNCKAVGYDLNAGGYIKVNDYLETNIEGVYAIGDINGGAAFRHRANADAEVLIYNLFQKEESEARRKTQNELCPAVTYTYPQVAHIGLTEEELKEKQVDYLVAKHHYSQTAKGYALGFLPQADNDGFIKLLVDKESRQILSAHAVGVEAGLMVQPYQYLIFLEQQDLQKENQTPSSIDLANQVMIAHPSLGEVSGWAPAYLEE